MSWNNYRSVMEQYAIKTDDMATEDAYFMATHMPFSQLEVYEGGQTSSKPIYKTEEQIFEELICNPQNLHRMIIVRGNNGTGKSHLIRYMKAKLENSPSTVYNPNTEQIIFLRRLNNSVRGVFSQLLDQNVIKDQDVAEKMRRFVKSSESKDEASFKTEILFAYIAAVANDKTNSTYKAIDCRNIAQYLSDSRVQDYLMREDGAISRCYRVITTPSDQVLKETQIFTTDDFGSKEAKKVNRTVKRDGNPDAQDFVQTIFNDDNEVEKLVDYLNRFTGSVVQRCADISSETTKSVFEQLRKDLKKQGKNLTLFIEDFTGFTGIDSELITVLSTEHGGDYDYLCRVTAVIGITDGYYDQFKDNFKDRVTHQISVTERSYGTSDFLIQMAALYLNSIFCNPDTIHDWYKSGANIENLPLGKLKTPCTWDAVTVNGKEMSLFPFNKSSINKLYAQLPIKTPRMFLRDVIKKQLKEYFDGKEYGEDWQFPINPGSVQMSSDPHSSTIDRNNEISLEDRQRLKTLLAIWGDGTASGIKYKDGTLYIGGIHKNFFDDIGLNNIQPIGEIETKDESAPMEGMQVHLPEVPSSLPDLDEPTEKEPSQRKETPEEKNYKRWKTDISNWYSNNTTLQYDDTYRTWVKTFLIGNNNQCGAIDWQDIGVPAFVASERLSNLSSFYIEGQGNNGLEDKAIVFIPRNVESKDMLLALLERQYHKNWDFQNAPYYQQRLITWLEKNRREICQKVMSAEGYENRLPIATWGLALQYIKAVAYGYSVDTSTDTQTIIQLFTKFSAKADNSYATREWADLTTFIKGKEAEFDSAYDLLVKGHNSTMGAVALSKDPKTFVYHSDELRDAVKTLRENKWDILQLLSEKKEKNMLTAPSMLLNDLYTRIKQVALAEQQHFQQTKESIEKLVGPLSSENLLVAVNAIKTLFSTFGQNGIPVKSKLTDRFASAPIDVVNNILKAISALEIKSDDVMAVLQAYAEHKYSFIPTESENHTAMEVVSGLLQDLLEIERLALSEEKKAKTAMSGYSGDDATDQVAEAAKEKLDSIYGDVELWEVIENAD